MTRNPSIPKQSCSTESWHPAARKWRGSKISLLTSPEVADTLAILTEEASGFRNDLVLRDDDALKFKIPEDAGPVFQMLLLMADGYAAGYRGAAAFDFQAVMEDFDKNIAILRKNFYKEEYLK